MAGKRKAKIEQVEVPINPAPAPAPIPAPAAPAPPAPVVDILPEGRKQPCVPDHIAVPDSPEAILNNVLCREINDPSQDESSHVPDPNITVLDEIAQGISHGTDINHVRDDALRIASHQTEKVNIVKALIRGVDINRLNRFVQVRDRAEHELAKASMRGDLRSTEYLSFLRWSATEIKQIMSDMNDESVASSGADSASMLNKMDHAAQAQEASTADKYKGTTPQGREIIRKQIYDIESKLEKAGKMKGQSKPTGKKKK